MQPVRTRIARRRMFARAFVVFTLLACAIAFAVAPPNAHAQSFSVTASSFQDYTINGQPDPALTLVRGQTYQFAVNAPGHPFDINTQPGCGTGNQYNDGVTNNGMMSGTLTFSVPLSAPALLYYQCSAHAAMSGQINVVSAPAVPSGGPFAMLVLIACLLAGGCLVFQGGRGRQYLDRSASR